MKLSESLFLQRHGEKIAAVLGCYDRLVITGTLLEVAYPAAVQHRLNERHLRCFELGEFTEPLREAVRENAQALAGEAGLEIEHLLVKGARKEDRIAALLAKRGEHPGSRRPDHALVPARLTLQRVVRGSITLSDRQAGFLSVLLELTSFIPLQISPRGAALPARQGLSEAGRARSGLAQNSWQADRLRYVPGC